MVCSITLSPLLRGVAGLQPAIRHFSVILGARVPSQFPDRCIWQLAQRFLQYPSFAGGETRTLTPFRTQVPKTCVSTIFHHSGSLCPVGLEPTSPGLTHGHKTKNGCFTPFKPYIGYLQLQARINLKQLLLIFLSF